MYRSPLFYPETVFSAIIIALAVEWIITSPDFFSFLAFCFFVLFMSINTSASINAQLNGSSVEQASVFSSTQVSLEEKLLEKEAILSIKTGVSEVLTNLLDYVPVSVEGYDSFDQAQLEVCASRFIFDDLSKVLYTSVELDKMYLKSYENFVNELS